MLKGCQLACHGKTPKASLTQCRAQLAVTRIQDTFAPPQTREKLDLPKSSVRWRTRGPRLRGPGRVNRAESTKNSPTSTAAGLQLTFRIFTR